MDRAEKGARLWSAIFGIVAMLLLTPNRGHAQSDADLPPHTGFDCWVGNEGKPYYTHYIRCIADRDIPAEPEADDRLRNLLDTLHRELHAGTGMETERELKTNAEIARERGGVINIRIHSYPSDWSWEEGMPERLVRAVLCKGDRSCTVMIRRD